MAESIFASAYDVLRASVHGETVDFLHLSGTTDADITALVRDAVFEARLDSFVLDQDVRVFELLPAELSSAPVRGDRITKGATTYEVQRARMDDLDLSWVVTADRAAAPTAVVPGALLLSGDQQSNGDRMLLSGDQQSGSDVLLQNG